MGNSKKEEEAARDPRHWAQSRERRSSGAVLTLRKKRGPTRNPNRKRNSPKVSYLRLKECSNGIRRDKRKTSRKEVTRNPHHQPRRRGTWRKLRECSPKARRKQKKRLASTMMKMTWHPASRKCHTLPA